MNDLGQALLQKVKPITKQWIQIVSQDREISSAQQLTHTAILDSLPQVLEGVATLLSEAIRDDLNGLDDNSLEHGVVRAQQGFDASEIAREYRILREVIFVALEADLLTGTAVEVLQATRSINGVLDRVIVLSLESYIEQRLTKLAEIEEQLVLTGQELTRLAQIHQEQLSQLAHELKNPLNSILGFSSLLLKKFQNRTETGEGNPADLQNIERVIRNGRHILAIINNSLDMARSQLGTQQLDLKTLALREFLDDLVANTLPLAQRKQLVVVMDCDRTPAAITTDAVRLRQIISNLLSNAVRYTQAGTIRVTCEQPDAQTWLIAIADTGIGISPDMQKRIFEPYFRVSPASNEIEDGTGLGLAIVHRLVTLLQGKIDLVSAPSQGSTFTLTFPLVLTAQERG
ncbi:MAG: HAMP domain-containing histidine kinase [Leptolyngbyaceae cyanobacterium SM1_1_3]|nr:HAMP domain-containing histidine kinase [Leptolyngbyaceae cyanobacterium SM1_1_3]NJN02590.1 HAMP domain-containing histidine kinase [Leptolyngbyaceae cyanobacterium RM1_1_2]